MYVYLCKEYIILIIYNVLYIMNPAICCCGAQSFIYFFWGHLGTCAMTAFATLSPFPFLPFRCAAYNTFTSLSLSLCRLPRTRSLCDFAAFAFGNVIWSVLFAALCLPFLRPLLLSLSLFAALLRFHCFHLCVCVSS